MLVFQLRSADVFCCHSLLAPDAEVQWISNYRRKRGQGLLPFNLGLELEFVDHPDELGTSLQGF
jgi:hypothetical protein